VTGRAQHIFTDVPTVEFLEAVDTHEHQPEGVLGFIYASHT
tara:strand:+ start:388 stop:510 length:123 start_codon:yes stop_codon:yes gene_type:complete